MDTYTEDQIYQNYKELTCGDYGPFQPPGELFYVENLATEPKLKDFRLSSDRELMSDVRAFSVDSAGEIYFVGNSNNQSSLYKIVPIAKVNMTVSDQVTISIIGDEEGQITLQKSIDLDFSNVEEKHHQRRNY